MGINAMNYTNPKIKMSIIIPYKNRLDNIKLVFEALSQQTMDKNEFEVIIGAMEYCKEYVGICNEFNDRLNIRTVMTGGEWKVSYARNIALRQAVGNVLVLLDADMIVGPNFLENLFNKHFSNNQNQCVVGQLISHDPEAEITMVQAKAFSHYEMKLIELENMENNEIDMRWKIPFNIPWSFAWTALIALPRKVMEENQLFFDLNFHGWGVEDEEWGYRIYRTGLPILLKKDVWGIHLPHLRDLDRNTITSKINYRYFLKKCPEFDVELTCAFGVYEANRIYLDMKKEIFNITNNNHSFFSILKGKVKGISTLIVGAIQGEDGRFENVSCFPEFDSNSATEILPIIGLALPYEENDIDICHVLSPIEKFDPKYRGIIKGECDRVSKKVEKIPTSVSCTEK